MSDNYFAGVGAIVLRDSKVLLVRHTYGKAKGLLLNPGGFMKHGEYPTDAVKREVLEETGVEINPRGMLCVRCSEKDWYMVFLCDYVSGEPKPDNDEISEALFMDCDELLQREDATDTVKVLVDLALNRKPIPAEITGNGRIMFAAYSDL